MYNITIISAFPIKREVAEKLEKTFKAKHDYEIEFIYEIDTSLIGGVLVIDGDNYYDATIKGQLLAIKKSLK